MPGSVTPEGDHITLRFVAPTEFRIDQLFLAEFDAGAPIIEACVLLSAEHSALGDCLEGLTLNDDQRVRLSRGEAVDLAFSAPALNAGLTRDFVLVTEGYYGPDEEPRAVEETSPSALKVWAPHPNPFTDATSVRFQVPAPGGPVSVRVYALSGRLVRELEDDVLSAGTYELAWDGRDDGGQRAASGVYFYEVHGPGLQERRKMVLVR
jgi:hypothetical protein